MHAQGTLYACNTTHSSQRGLMEVLIKAGWVYRPQWLSGYVKQHLGFGKAVALGIFKGKQGVT